MASSFQQTRTIYELRRECQRQQETIINLRRLINAYLDADGSRRIYNAGKLIATREEIEAAIKP